MNFFFGGPFWAKNRKSAKKVAFCQKSSDLSAKHGVRTGLAHRIQYFWRIGKILKIADFMDKSVDAKKKFCLSLAVRHLPKNYWILAWNTSLEAPWPRDSESLDRYEKNKKLRILWAKYCDSAYFHFLLKLVNPLLTKLLVVQKIV